MYSLFTTGEVVDNNYCTFFKVTDPEKAVLDLEQEVGGLCLRRFVDDTITVPEHLRFPVDPLQKYFNQQLNLHSSGSYLFDI